MADIPDGLALETVYLVEVPYTPEAAERRPAHRLEHLGRIRRLVEEGVVIEAGGCLDFSKAVLLLRVADEAAARRLIEQDVYTHAGVWQAPTVRAFGRVVIADRA
jgi:uncharacterized protein YciI